jgi:hypothetical protein
MWKSAYTTVVWRGRWSIGTVQIIIEKQSCRICKTKCQGYLADEEQIEFTLKWMFDWILDVFYDIKNEDAARSDDETDENEEQTGPHAHLLCEAGKKKTCRKCNLIRQHHN